MRGPAIKALRSTLLISILVSLIKVWANFLGNLDDAFAIACRNTVGSWDVDNSFNITRLIGVCTFWMYYPTRAVDLMADSLYV